MKNVKLKEIPWNPTGWTTRFPWKRRGGATTYMTLKIQVLAWNRHENGEGLIRFMRSQPLFCLLSNLYPMIPPIINHDYCCYTYIICDNRSYRDTKPHLCHQKSWNLKSSSILMKDLINAKGLAKTQCVL